MNLQFDLRRAAAPQPVTIAMAGKGGTGKTTLAALLIRGLMLGGKRPVLAVDADPNSTLGETLGLPPGRTVGDTIDSYIDERDGVPPGMTKDAYLGLRLSEILVESAGFDLLVMGRPEGQGCYCAVNNVLRMHLDALTSNYAAVVMDNEAGMEHVSRHTTRQVDHLVLVSDNTIRGVKAAGRISALCDDLEIGVGARWLVVNRAQDGVAPAVRREAAAAGLEVAAAIPEDQQVVRLELSGRSLLELPDDSSAASAAGRLLRMMLG